KAFTATLAAILVDEKRIGWDDPVRRHLPGLVLSDPYLTEHVTLRDLLAHRTGISSNAMWKLTRIDRAEMLRRLRCIPARAPFRSEQTYSNVGYAVLGEALAAAGGASWEDLVRRRILEPLGMADTTVSYAEAMARPNHAS